MFFHLGFRDTSDYFRFLECGNIIGGVVFLVLFNNSFRTIGRLQHLSPSWLLAWLCSNQKDLFPADLGSGQTFCTRIIGC